MKFKQLSFAMLGVFASMLAPAFAADEVVTRTEVENTNVEARSPAATTDSSDATGVSQSRTEVTQEVVEKGGLDDQVVGITAQAGFVNLDDDSGAGNTRAVGGLSVDGNFLAGVDTKNGKPFLGPSVGVFYSHLGQPGGNLFGINSPAGDEGAHLLMLPLNLKVGYTFSDVVRLGVHGGVSISYLNSARQATTVTATPTTVTTTTGTFRDDDWDTNTNVGGDVEIGLGQDVFMLIRPDWTFRNTGDAFTGTLGIGFPLS